MHKHIFLDVGALDVCASLYNLNLAVSKFRLVRSVIAVPNISDTDHALELKFKVLLCALRGHAEDGETSISQG